MPIGTLPALSGTPIQARPGLPPAIQPALLAFFHVIVGDDGLAAPHDFAAEAGIDRPFVIGIQALVPFHVESKAHRGALGIRQRDVEIARINHAAGLSVDQFQDVVGVQGEVDGLANAAQRIQFADAALQIVEYDRTFQRQGRLIRERSQEGQVIGRIDLSGGLGAEGQPAIELMMPDEWRVQERADHFNARLIGEQ